MKNFENIKLSLKSTIREALNKIDKGAIKIAVVVDESDKLLGTIVDGDIRRAILKGKTLDDLAQSIMFTDFFWCSVDETKETILKKAINRNIYQVPILENDGTLVGIEIVRELLKKNNHPNKVVLMAGGLGSRLKPLTDNIPKPLLKVGNKPILETVINSFMKYGFTDIVIIVNYQYEKIQDYFGDGKKFGVNIEYIVEDKKLGTAGGLSLLQTKPDDPFFVMNGDLLTNINFEHLLEYHINHQAIGTMAVREYDFQVPYGVVNIENKSIVSIVEKPVHTFSVNGGIYVLNPRCIDYIPKNQYLDMPDLFLKMVKSEENMISFPIKEYWLDIGQLDEFKRANMEYSKYFTND